VTSSYAAATIHRRPVIIDDALKKVRGEALDVLEMLFKEAVSDDERSLAFSAMMTATAHPSAGKYEEDAISLANGDSSRVVRFITAHHAGLSFELLQHIEHSLLFLYHRSPAWFEGCGENIKDEGELLKGDIRIFRDAINADHAYVIHKTLVGFEAVFPHDWEIHDSDGSAEKDYRLEQVDKLVGEVNPDTAGAWLPIIKRCAATASNDGATFLTFIEFVNRLAKAQPAVVFGYLKSPPVELESFINNFLDGLDDGASAADAQALMRSWIDAGAYLPQIGRHLRLAKTCDEKLIRSLAEKAITIGNVNAVIEALVVAVARKEFIRSALVDDVFIPSVQFLTKNKDVQWLYHARFQATVPTFFASLRADQVAVVLDNLIELPKIDSQTQRVIGGWRKRITTPSGDFSVGVSNARKRRHHRKSLMMRYRISSTLENFRRWVRT
jgi:hypothetical protein